MVDGRETARSEAPANRRLVPHRDNPLRREGSSRGLRIEDQAPIADSIGKPPWNGSCSTSGMSTPRYPFHSLLVPTDFSSSSEAAVALAIDMARTHGGRLMLVHVSDIGATLALDAAMSSAAMGIAAAVGVDQQMQENARHALENLAERVRGQGIEVEIVSTEGTPEARIVELATERGADAIIMGTQGRSGLEQLLVGSVAEKVVRSAPVPVITVHAPA